MQANTDSVPPTLANRFPEWQPNSDNDVCHRALSLIPMPVLYQLFQMCSMQFGPGGIVIEDWADDHQPCLSFQTVNVMAEMLVLTHVGRYKACEDELRALLLAHTESPVVIVLYRRLGGLAKVQLRTDLVPLTVVAATTTP